MESAFSSEGNKLNSKEKLIDHVNRKPNREFVRIRRENTADRIHSKKQSLQRSRRRNCTKKQTERRRKKQSNLEWLQAFLFEKMVVRKFA